MHVYKTFRQANLDIWLLWSSVFLRLMSFGVTNQVMVLFLRKVEIPESKIGYFMTLTLVGDVLISYFLTWNADKLGRRNVLVAGTVMMFAAGAIFCTQSGFIILLIAAIFGVISPSGDETGPFKSIEEACIAHLTPHNHRPEVFAFHGMFSSAGTAIGSLLSGMIIDYLNLSLHWDLISCYRGIFAIYSSVAIVKFFIMVSLSEKCEIYGKVANYESDEEQEGEQEADENSPLTGSSSDTITSESTISVASKLLVVFFLDSLGYGFMPSSWIVYYFKDTYKISATLLGSLFFLTSIVNTVTTIPSALFAKIFGPVKAILMTQAPSAIFFITIAFSNNVIVSSVLLIVYYATMAMDVVPRQILITSVVKKDALTKVMGTVNTVKTFARCVGPIFTGNLSEKGLLYVCFLISGGFTLLCDFILGYNFIGLDAKIKKKQLVNHTIQ